MNYSYSLFLKQSLDSLDRCLFGNQVSPLSVPIILKFDIKCPSSWPKFWYQPILSHTTCPIRHIMRVIAYLHATGVMPVQNPRQKKTNYTNGIPLNPLYQVAFRNSVENTIRKEHNNRRAKNSEEGKGRVGGRTQEGRRRTRRRRSVSGDQLKKRQQSQWRRRVYKVR